MATSCNKKLISSLMDDSRYLQKQLYKIKELIESAPLDEDMDSLHIQCGALGIAILAVSKRVEHLLK